jgi:hypothetical protein
VCWCVGLTLCVGIFDGYGVVVMCVGVWVWCRVLGKWMDLDRGCRRGVS